MGVKIRVPVLLCMGCCRSGLPFDGQGSGITSLTSHSPAFGRGNRRPPSTSSL